MHTALVIKFKPCSEWYIFRWHEIFWQFAIKEIICKVLILHMLWWTVAIVLYHNVFPYFIFYYGYQVYLKCTNHLHLLKHISIKFVHTIQFCIFDFVLSSDIFIFFVWSIFDRLGPAFSHLTTNVSFSVSFRFVKTVPTRFSPNTRLLSLESK